MRFRIALLGFMVCMAGPVSAGEVEVLHWWTSGGESKSVAVLKQLMEDQGHTWKDLSVAGGGGDSAMTVLKSRVFAGNPPVAAQMKAPLIKEWAYEGVLTNLDAIAARGRWDALLPTVIRDAMKYEGHYVAVPVNIHRVNWMWVNPKVFEKAGAKIPTTWAEFEVAAKAIEKAGFIAVAHGGKPWQEATVFESVVLGIGGADFYREAFVALKPEALKSATMARAFDMLKTIKRYTDKDAPGRDWNLATAMIISGRAGMQFMGDWAKGEFLNANQKPGVDFLCFPVPETQGMFIYNVDSFAMFEQTKREIQFAQNDLAKTIMEPEFQEVFSLNKGSIPVRLNMPMDKFDQYAVASLKDFSTSTENRTLVPSMAHDMATSPSTKGAIYDVVTLFYNSEMSSAEACKRLVLEVRASL
ncbi:Carbohydrate ABC transporter substrate-binding protein [Sulfidibacter corallicola]|uniref:Probable sugar-binding periplasmic protein n=1 Tax=Sulfidibacter corallicola TaxID=2818388 RepID=A0A8A4TU46_SULCO|nr:ABC transporter substrate-binding protein [Sulfidibacter corallicola]QTD50055.1 carbohydrate ABC transporter substrate-binding protein [Sulfidibacter corallicola]